MSLGFTPTESPALAPASDSVRGVPAPTPAEIVLDLGRWMARRLGLPPTAGGYGTSGGAMAAFIALKAARDARAGWSIRELGTRSGPPLTVYASGPVGGVAARATDMLGLGRDAVRMIAGDRAGRIRVDALRAAVRRDVRNGFKPIAVIVAAGSVASGAIDPIDEIADVAVEHDLWLHVDACYAGAAVLMDGLRAFLHGIERADSVALDAHMWLDTPHAKVVVIARDVQCLADAFVIQPSDVSFGTGVEHIHMAIERSAEAGRMLQHAGLANARSGS